MSVIDLTAVARGSCDGMLLNPDEFDGKHDFRFRRLLTPLDGGVLGNGICRRALVAV